uniref:Protein FAR1-RELATED SEQUENCE n=1 Tax=Lactuca sativa TaxID=4236 RepID=A0A9R1VL74_LACSA|nr:hypothetical protein LSAT_V11C500267390 [Lactuca sativa]
MRIGIPPKKSLDMRKKHNANDKVTYCRAKIVLKYINRTCDYKFEKFEEMHSHKLGDIYNLIKTRKLSHSDKEFIVRASTEKIGDTKAYKLKSNLKGDFQQRKQI